MNPGESIYDAIRDLRKRVDALEVKLASVQDQQAAGIEPEPKAKKAKG